MFPGATFPKPATGGPAPEALEEAAETLDVLEPIDAPAQLDAIDAPSGAAEVVLEPAAVVVDGEVAAVVEEEPYTGPEPGNEAVPASKTRARKRPRAATTKKATTRTARPKKKTS